MYWYYKYPLLLIAVVLLLLASIGLWRKCLSPYVWSLIHRGGPAEEQPAIQELTAPVEGGEEKPVVASVQGMSADLQLLLEQAQKEFDAEQLKAARESARSGLEQCDEYSENWMKFALVINEVNRIFMNSSAPAPEKARYVIQAGDSLTRIAYKMNTTVESLQKLSGLSVTSSVIHPGNPLIYINGTWSIKVSKTQFLLILYLDGQLYRLYRISTGRQDRTPAGNFVICQKQSYPTWTYEGQSIPFGDPRNILGTRWLGLQATDEVNIALRGYGIHGTTEPDKIGQPASLGCIRMLNEEVEELYDIIPNSFSSKPVVVTIEE